MTERPRLLILSFSPIEGDARVLKQVTLFSEQYDVTTCGYGAAPKGVARHIRIPDDQPQNDLYPRYVALRLYERVYWRTSAVAWCRKELEPGSWDVVLANDFETIPLALSLKAPCGVHADLHEYTPKLHSENKGWMRWFSPYYRWMARKYVRRVSSSTTVGAGLARQYEKEFGFKPGVVNNAAPEWALAPSEPTDRIRLVHSGAGLRNRHLDIMLEAVALSTTRPTLDLYLTPNHPDFIVQLRMRAAELDGVTVHDPVSYSELIPTLNAFDMGVFVLPPVNFSYEWALPNKIFDYVQARLGIIVGPSPEMAAIVRDNELGVVTRDFTAQALAAAIDELTEETIAQFKAASHSAASTLNAAAEVQGWGKAIAALLVARRAVSPTR
jgi:hypothetical protein